jgi:hypothetical protein
MSKKTAAAKPTITLHRRITEKGGVTSYARTGVRASIYFSKGMFRDGVPPETVTLVNSRFFAEPAGKTKTAKAKAAPTKAKARAADLAVDPAAESTPEPTPEAQVAPTGAPIA